MDLPLTTAIDYIIYALEKEREQTLWELWSGLYPLMEAGFVGFKSFDEYKRELSKPRVKHSNKALEDISSEMLAVVSAYEGR